MARTDISSCSVKGKEICTGEVNGGDQTQFNASESRLIQLKRTFYSGDERWQVSKNVCIYRVLKYTRNFKPQVYDPLVVSFGPYHYNINPELSKMDAHKLEAVHRMLARCEIDLTILDEEIQKLEREIRECYEEPIHLTGEALSLMLAMDACFILEFLRDRNTDDGFNLVFQRGENCMCRAILDDIIKLENQIPLFILITLLELEFKSRERAIEELAAMLCGFIDFRGFPFFSFSWVHDEKEYIEKKSRLKRYIEKEPPPCHLLDLSRMMIKDLLTNSGVESGTIGEREGSGADNINNDDGRCGWSINVSLSGWMQRLSCIDDSRSTPTVESSDDTRSTPSAELLHKAGVKFQPGQLGFEKRRFGRSIFSLPRITIFDSTEISLRNLMAYEECQKASWSPDETVISHFVRLLDDLIDSERDVSLLRKSLVIESWVGSDEEIARMVNRLCDGITFDSLKFFDVVMEKARQHYKTQWRVWMSQFKDEHCSKPWYVVSLVAAILILGMTAVQTVYSVKSYNHSL